MRVLEFVFASLIQSFHAFFLAIMSTGEIDFNGFMYNDTTEVYYKTAGFLILIVFAIAMTILVSNLLIGE